MCSMLCSPTLPFFFFNDTATTEIYTLSLHDALPISDVTGQTRQQRAHRKTARCRPAERREAHHRSEEHTSELQSPCNLVCRLLLEKKKKQQTKHNNTSSTDIHAHHKRATYHVSDMQT